MWNKTVILARSHTENDLSKHLILKWIKLPSKHPTYIYLRDMCCSLMCFAHNLWYYIRSMKYVQVHAQAVCEQNKKKMKEKYKESKCLLFTNENISNSMAYYKFITYKYESILISINYADEQWAHTHTQQTTHTNWWLKLFERWIIILIWPSWLS